jgi:osmotically-inducible protein OsmY
MRLSTMKPRRRGARRAMTGWMLWRTATRLIRRRKRRRSAWQLLGAVAFGAAAGFVLWKLARGRRDMGREAEATATSAPEERPLEDTELERKVEEALARPSDASKPRVAVRVTDGVVELSGQVEDPSDRQWFVETAQQVDGVKEVRNLLHA